MEITRIRPPSRRGPAKWFTGDVFIDPIAAGAQPSRLRALSVHFTPGARTAWHTHPLGQFIHVTEGAGLVQRVGGPVLPIRAGDTVRFEPGEEHWHGAAPDSFMTHLALHEAGDDGADAHWGAHVTDHEYLAPPVVE
jgi:quercetin dioxygenase-like cupin family protein